VPTHKKVPLKLPDGATMIRHFWVALYHESVIQVDFHLLHGSLQFRKHVGDISTIKFTLKHRMANKPR